MRIRLVCGLIAACSMALSSAAAAADAMTEFATPAPSIDSGLGDLPRYHGSPEVWLYSQPAAKQDSGLGDLDAAGLAREVWVHQHPAPKVDNDVGAAPGTERVAGNVAAEG